VESGDRLISSGQIRHFSPDGGISGPEPGNQDLDEVDTFTASNRDLAANAVGNGRKVVEITSVDHLVEQWHKVTDYSEHCSRRPGAAVSPKTQEAHQSLHGLVAGFVPQANDPHPSPSVSREAPDRPRLHGRASRRSRHFLSRSSMASTGWRAAGLRPISDLPTIDGDRAVRDRLLAGHKVAGARSSTAAHPGPRVRGRREISPERTGFCAT